MNKETIIILGFLCMYILGAIHGAIIVNQDSIQDLHILQKDLNQEKLKCEIKLINQSKTYQALIFRIEKYYNEYEEFTDK